MARELTRNDPLAKALTREAEATRPAFSPLVHERTMQAIRDGRRTAQRPAAYELPRRRHWPLTAVAAVLICAVGVGAWWHWQSGQPVAKQGAGPVPHQVAVLPEVPDFSQMLDHVTQPAREQVASVRLSGLDHDAARVAQYLIDSVDVMPGVRARGATTQRSGT